MTRPLALANLSALDASPPRLVRAAAAAGFDAVTVRLLPSFPAEGLYPMAPGSPMLAETVQALRDTGVGVLEIEVLLLAPDLEVASIEPALAAGAELGARHLLVVGVDEDEQRATENFAAVCRLCDAFAIRPVLEFVPFTRVARLADAVRIVLAAGHATGGVLVDPLHLRRSGGDPAEVAALARDRPALLPYAQLCDAPLAAPGSDTRALYAEAVQNRLLPGEGELPLRELVAALPPGAPLSIETPVRRLADVAVEERLRLMYDSAREFRDEEAARSCAR